MKIYRISQENNLTPPKDVDETKKPKPKVMYHGTLKDFDDFEVGRETLNSNVFGSWKTNRNAIFFTPDPNHASAFTSSGGKTEGGNIRPVYLNIISPLDFRNGVNGDILEEFEKVGINPRWLINFDWGHLDDDDGKLLVDAAKKLGYDAIIFNDDNPETKEEMETWAVFDPSKIKSIYAKSGVGIKIYRIAREYFEVGHDSNSLNPTYLWIIDTDFNVLKYKSEDKYETHRSVFSVEDETGYAQGRYIVNTKECSIYYLDQSVPPITIRNLLKEEFGPISKFYEWGRFAKLVSKQYKTSNINKNREGYF